MAWSADGIEFGEGDVVYDGNGKRYVVEEISFQSEFVNRPDGIYLVDDNDNIEFLFGSEVYVLSVNAPHEARRRVAHEVIDQDEDEFYCPTCDEVTMTSMEVVGRPACAQCQTTYPCPECGAPELDEPDHDSDKPFMCDACGAVFDESNLGTAGSRRQAGSMEQDMGNMAESFDGGSASGGGGGVGGYIYDVSDYDTYARTYNTVTDVPEGSDDSAPATTGSRKTAAVVDVYLAEFDSGRWFTDWSREDVDYSIILRRAGSFATSDMGEAAAETAYAICNSYPGELFCSTIYADDVALYRRDKNRSLSVGDAVTVDGVWYVCGDFGWNRIDNPADYGVIAKGAI